MKVTTDFLPDEYKSFVFDLRAAMVSAIFLGISVVVCGMYHLNHQDVAEGLKKEIAKREKDIATLENQINSKSYNQGEIQELIDKFNFIKEAVGARDFPYLRFYHSFEKTIPIDEATGARRIAVGELSKTRGGKYKMRGLARHWDDLLRFEQNLTGSTFDDPETGRTLKNFGAVKMGAWSTTPEGIEFTAEFVFNG